MRWRASGLYPQGQRPAYRHHRAWPALAQQSEEQFIPFCSSICMLFEQNIHQVSLERERVCVLWASQGTDAGCPCGGTHVGDVAEIRGMRITGVRVKKGTTRVSYVID